MADNTTTQPTQTIESVMGQQVNNPSLPAGTEVAPVTQTVQQNELIDKNTGTINPNAQSPTATTATAAQTQAPTPVQATQYDATKVGQKAPQTQAQQGTVSDQAKAQAAQGQVSQQSVAQAQQGQATQITNAPVRTLQEGELVSGSAVDQTKVNAALNAAQAAQGAVTPEMTVAGQLEKLTANFAANNPPPWAAGALRTATALMASRGLGASTMAGQAIVQAALESAMPIATADAAANLAVGQQNLSNRQQMALQTAQMRAQFLGQEFDQNFQTRVLNSAKLGEIANMNFTAQQQVVLENARLMQEMNITNLNNRQATAIANAATYASMDRQNLDNRQQALLQNAQAFLQMDMRNLDNRQQSAIINHQAQLQAMLSDQSADNAAKQFNAASKTEVDQFMSNLASQISMSNTSQKNAMEQFNTGEVNTMKKFTTELQSQREQFNAQNQIAIEQSNVQWRRSVNTANTAAENAAIATNAQNRFNLSATAMANLWQQARDTMEYAFTAGENDKARAANMAIAVFQAQTNANLLSQQQSAGFWDLIGGTIANVVAGAFEED